MRWFETTTKDEMRIAELNAILRQHYLSRRDLAVIVSTLRLHPEVTLDDIPREPKSVVARPLKAKEQQDLMDTAERALSSLQSIYECAVEKHGADDLFPKMIKSAIDIFTKMRSQWALAVGHPQEISGETLEKIVDAVIAHTKRIMKSQIHEGKF